MAKKMEKWSRIRIRDRITTKLGLSQETVLECHPLPTLPGLVDVR